MHNAIKYSGENSNIIVNISANESNIFFSIKDNGIGIPKNEQNLIFNRFFRAKNALYYPGTGIGLNIVKGYINNLNGNISFEDVKAECDELMEKSKAREKELIDLVRKHRDETRKEQSALFVKLRDLL